MDHEKVKLKIMFTIVIMILICSIFSIVYFSFKMHTLKENFYSKDINNIEYVLIYSNNNFSNKTNYTFSEIEKGKLIEEIVSKNLQNSLRENNNMIEILKQERISIDNYLSSVSFIFLFFSLFITIAFLLFVYYNYGHSRGLEEQIKKDFEKLENKIKKDFEIKTKEIGKKLEDSQKQAENYMNEDFETQSTKFLEKMKKEERGFD